MAETPQSPITEKHRAYARQVAIGNQIMLYVAGVASKGFEKEILLISQEQFSVYDITIGCTARVPITHECFRSGIVSSIPAKDIIDFVDYCQYDTWKIEDN